MNEYDTYFIRAPELVLGAEQREAFVRQRWNWGRVVRPEDFDELLALFQDERYTAAEISRRFGVSRERMRQLYNKYFEPICPWRSCVDRRRTRIVKRLAERMHPPLNELPPALQAVATQCEALGYMWRLQLYKRPLKSATSRLIINDRFVPVYVARRGMNIYGVHYARFHSTIKQFDNGVCVCVAMVPQYPVRMFVVPSGDLSKMRYARLSPRKKRGTGLWLDQYEDRWELLKLSPKLPGPQN